MAKIDVYTIEMCGLAERLNRISSAIEDAENTVAKVQRNLDFEIAAKQSIADGLITAKGALQKQSGRTKKLSKLTSEAVEEYSAADGKMDKSVRNILGKIMSPIVSITRNVNSFFVGTNIKQHQMINSLFMREKAICITAVGTTKLIKDLGKVITAPTGGSRNLVPFPSENYAGKIKGACENYSILPGMRPGYCYNQGDSKNVKFRNMGCLSCADACIGAITGKVVNPNPEDTWNDTKFTTCRYTAKIDQSVGWTPAQVRSKAYEELTQGRPVVIRVMLKYGGHNVAVVGLRNGADPNNLTDADFLIMDSDGGKIKPLSEIKIQTEKGYKERIVPGDQNAGMRVVK